MKNKKIFNNIANFFSRRALLVTPLALVSLAFITSVVANPSVAVYIDGQLVGTVAHRDDFDSKISQIETYTSSILGKPYSTDFEVEYRLSYSTHGNFLDEESTNSLLSAYVNEVATLSVIYVDDEAVAAMSENDDALQVLEQIKIEAVGEEDAPDAQFEETVHILEEVTDISLLKTKEEAIEVLLATKKGEVTHVVEQNETLSGIANVYGMESEHIYTLNPDVEPTRMQIGETIVIEKESAAVSVRVEKEETYTVDVAYGTDKTYDNDLTTSQKKTISSGVVGTNEVTANIVYVNGEEVSREILSEVVLKTPVNEVVAYGTKATVVTGNFGMPTYGATISSAYGYRSSGFHTGIDLAASYGTPIYASDGGTVIFSGWNGAYGNCIIIDHGDGVTTLYGHASSLLVSVGTKLNKGDKIALMGSTGRSTGNHLHFEIRINNTHVNPYGYIFG